MGSPIPISEKATPGNIEHTHSPKPRLPNESRFNVTSNIYLLEEKMKEPSAKKASGRKNESIYMLQQEINRIENDVKLCVKKMKQAAPY